MVKQDIKRTEMKEQFNYLIANINRIVIPKALLDGLKNGTRKLLLRQRCFNFYYDPQTQAVVHSSASIPSGIGDIVYSHLIKTHSITLKFGLGNTNEYLQ